MSLCVLFCFFIFFASFFLTLLLYICNCLLFYFFIMYFTFFYFFIIYFPFLTLFFTFCFLSILFYFCFIFYFLLICLYLLFFYFFVIFIFMVIWPQVDIVRGNAPLPVPTRTPAGMNHGGSRFHRYLPSSLLFIGGSRW